MERKYEFTNFSIMYKGHRLHQIRALRSFGNIKKGTLGGFIESEFNLAHIGECWVTDNAFVYETACIIDNAYVCNDVRIYGEACISGDARIYSYAEVYDHAHIGGSATIRGNAKIYENAGIYDTAVVANFASVHGEAFITGDARIWDNAEVYGQARITNDATIQDFAIVKGYTKVCDCANIRDKAIIADWAMVFNNSIVGGNIVINEHKRINNGVIYKDTIEEQIKCQTGLIPCNGEVIAYKIVKPNLSSAYDENFKYKIGEWVEAENVDESNRSCSAGLHFSNATYWDSHFFKFEGKPVYLIARINLKDIITVQEGKIRCRKAFILGKYEV